MSAEHDDRDDSIPQVDFEPGPLDDRGFEGRYRLGRTLGRGGMGEVQTCQDLRIGREVAIKLLEPENQRRTNAFPRFVREARVQGQLEHPAVVPVYDLGTTPHGTTYFTMRRVHGETLGEVLKGLRRDDPELRERYSRRRLLNAFSSVCLAIDFAHERGVIHSDLKPSNLMFGAYGEVYILDWGAAAPPHTQPEGSKVVGTPGYMAPEQLRGKPIDARTDVYALGCLLFEMLTLKPLHPRRNADEAIQSTIQGADPRASVWAPEHEIPPELDTICARATEADLDARYESARELHNAIERFLDGNRDMELRHRMSTEHAERAEHATERALAHGPDALEDRRQAMRDVSRALALDPNNARATRAMARLLLEPPREIPPEARREIQQDERRTLQTGSRLGAIVWSALLLFVPLTMWMGVRSWPAVLISIALIAASAIANALSIRRPGTPVGTRLVPAMSMLAVGGLSHIFGPYILVPALTATMAMGLTMLIPRGQRVAIPILGTLAILLPAMLSWWGIVPPAYAFEGDVMRVLPRSHPFPAVPSTLFLLLSSIALVIGASIFSGRVRDALTDAHARLHVHTWHMRQFLQDTRRDTATSPPLPSSSTLPPDPTLPTMRSSPR